MKTPEEMWDAFIKAVCADSKLADDLEVVNLIGGVKKFRKLFLNAVREENETN